METCSLPVLTNSNWILMLLHVEICEICIICIKPYKKPLFWVTINDSCMVIRDVWRQVPIYSSNWWNRVSSVDRGCSHHHGTIWTIPQRMPQILWKIRQKWRMNQIDLSRNNHQKIRNATEGIQISVVRQSDDEKGKPGTYFSIA